MSGLSGAFEQFKASYDVLKVAVGDRGVDGGLERLFRGFSRLVDWLCWKPTTRGRWSAEGMIDGISTMIIMAVERARIGRYAFKGRGVRIWAGILIAVNLAYSKSLPTFVRISVARQGGKGLTGAAKRPAINALDWVIVGRCVACAAVGSGHRSHCGCGSRSGCSGATRKTRRTRSHGSRRRSPILSL